MIKKLITTVMATLAVMLVATTSFAADVPIKIGVIDIQKIMQKSSQVAAINSQLEKRFKPRQQNILAARKTLREEAEKLSRNSAVMSEGERIKLQNKILADRASLQAAEVSYQQEINGVQGQETQKFMRKLKDVVAQIAQSGGYTLIMIKQGVPYVSDKLDITDLVSTNLEKK